MTTYENGKIPLDALTPLSVGGRLLAPAAAAFERWRALADKAGRVLTITSAADAYRDRAAQERVFLERYAPRASGGSDVRWYNGRRYVRVRGAAAAVPGTSNHGRGLAVDIANAGAFGGGFHNWLLATGPALGWSNVEGRSVNEPWHWVYDPDADTHHSAGGASASTPAPTTPSPTAGEDHLMRIVTRIGDEAAYLVGPTSMIQLTFEQAQAYLALGVPLARLNPAQVLAIMQAVHYSAADEDNTQTAYRGGGK